MKKQGAGGMVDTRIKTRISHISKESLCTRMRESCGSSIQSWPLPKFRARMLHFSMNHQKYLWVLDDNSRLPISWSFGNRDQIKPPGNPPAPASPTLCLFSLLDSFLHWTCALMTPLREGLSVHYTEKHSRPDLVTTHPLTLPHFPLIALRRYVTCLLTSLFIICLSHSTLFRAGALPMWVTVVTSAPRTVTHSHTVGSQQMCIRCNLYPVMCWSQLTMACESQLYTSWPKRMFSDIMMVS